MRESPVGILEECADWLESEAQGYRNRALNALKMGQKGSADALLEQAGKLERYALSVSIHGRARHGAREQRGGDRNTKGSIAPKRVCHVTGTL